ncbi:hypothetical protein [Halosegnis longus]|uniref:Uncharacterized protein n=1 Tax=Halosegnis longus TaxID=2216012 RepID=A0AAJ4UW13_9EURY|nr:MULTISPECIES: hypothetical protein [Halobacteriales]RNJ26602.1 hypothetical protein Nmn1133_07905 [Salella cibi]
MVTEPTVGDHLATDHRDYRSGVYRVVGVGDRQVTLLVVGDEEGKRLHTGEVVSVPRSALDDFAAVEPPTRRQSLRESIQAGRSIGYWSLRSNARQLRARPTQTAVVALLLGGGLLLDVLNLAPETVTAALVVAGSLLFVFVATGRL